MLLCVFLTHKIIAQAVGNYDSVTISWNSIHEKWYGAKWSDSVRIGTFRNYVRDEKTIWVKPAIPAKAIPALIPLLEEIRKNGTEDIAKCFIPRHSVNFYKNGKIERYLLVCFECDGVHFSDDPSKQFVKSVDVREKQIEKLKYIFKNYL